MSDFPFLQDSGLLRFLQERQPIIILVRPQMGENIGATARAMLNCGLTKLRLVDPRDGWPNPAAVAMASGADLVLDQLECFETVEKAVSDCHQIYAATARLRDLEKDIVTPKTAVIQIEKSLKVKEKVAILFGAERAGLSNEEVAFAHHIMSVPLNPDFKSLNLSQSVLIFCYEFFQNIIRTFHEYESVLKIVEGQEPKAPQGDIDNLLKRLIEQLDQRGFFVTEAQKPTMILNLKNMFYRNHFTEQEVRTLHGIISTLIKS